MSVQAEVDRAGNSDGVADSQIAGQVVVARLQLDAGGEWLRILAVPRRPGNILTTSRMVSDVGMLRTANCVRVCRRYCKCGCRHKAHQHTKCEQICH